MHPEAEYWIRALNLQPHPEGGWYRETYRSAETIPADGLPARFGAPRCCSTAILFLLEGGTVSALHRIRSDELWHFYAGGVLRISMIEGAGTLRELRLGVDPAGGASVQAVVPAGAWFGARLEEPGSFALVGCTVSPGFDFADFELADRAALAREFPALTGWLDGWPGLDRNGGPAYAAGSPEIPIHE